MELLFVGHVTKIYIKEEHGFTNFLKEGFSQQLKNSM